MCIIIGSTWLSPHPVIAMEWVDTNVTTPADWLLCTICHYPSREPHLSDCCGNTFCKSCLEGLKKATAVANACPICRNEEFLTFRNKQADRLVRSLHVFCTNKEKGCEWQGELNDIIGHLVNSEGCKFEEVTCSNDCGRCLQRQYLISHVKDECVRRKVDCQYCHISGEHQFIEGKHKKQCPKFPVACPNKCALPTFQYKKVKDCSIREFQNDLVISHKYLHWELTDTYRHLAWSTSSWSG